MGTNEPIERTVGLLRGLVHIMTVDGRWYLTDLVTGYRMDADCTRRHRAILESILPLYLDKMIDNLVGFKGMGDGSVTVWIAKRDGTSLDNPAPASEVILFDSHYPQKGDAC